MRVDDEQVGVFGRIQRDVEGDHGQDARGREYAALAGLHVEERDLTSLVGEHERAQAPAADKDHSGAPRPGALNMAARVEFHAAG